MKMRASVSAFALVVFARQPSPKLVFKSGEPEPWAVEISRGPTLLFAEDVAMARPLKLPKIQGSSQEFPVLRIHENRWVVDDFMVGGTPTDGTEDGGGGNVECNVGRADVINTFVLAGRECLEEAGITPGDIPFQKDRTLISGSEGRDVQLSNNSNPANVRPQPVRQQHPYPTQYKPTDKPQQKNNLPQNQFYQPANIPPNTQHQHRYPYNGQQPYMWPQW